MQEDNSGSNSTRNYRRQTQRSIGPTSINPRQLSENTLFNTTATVNGPYTLNNGSALQIRSIVKNAANSQFILGGAPYFITFLQGTLDTSNILGDPNGVSFNGYHLYGPLAMSAFSPYAVNPSTPGGNDGYDLVFVTELINNTGSQKTIYYITNTRVYMPRGGGA